jgi:hypothetical protein
LWIIDKGCTKRRYFSVFFDFGGVLKMPGIATIDKIQALKVFRGFRGEKKEPV